MNDGFAIFVVVLLVVVIVALIVIGPLFSIWSLHTLFALEIPFSFKTWVAMIWVHTILHGIRTTFKKTERQQNNQ